MICYTESSRRTLGKRCAMKLEGVHDKTEAGVWFFVCRKYVACYGERFNGVLFEIEVVVKLEPHA